MCRFLAYQGPSTCMEDLLFKQPNSLIEQSRHAKFRTEPTNGDGFGIGWYPEHDDPQPGTFRSIEPAWNNHNLLQLARKVPTGRFFAHVRDATHGMPVSQANCHPFQWGRYLWMHNGLLDGFSRVKRAINTGFSDRAFHLVKGNTDSEYAFAMFLDRIGFREAQDLATLSRALSDTILNLLVLRKTHGADRPAYLNFALTDGRHSLFTRFCSHRDSTPASLFYRQGDAVIVASEPLSAPQQWTEVKAGHLVSIDAEGTLQSTAMALPSQADL